MGALFKKQSLHIDILSLNCVPPNGIPVLHCPSGQKYPEICLREKQEIICRRLENNLLCIRYWQTGQGTSKTTRRELVLGADCWKI